MKGSSIGIYLRTPTREIIKQSFRLSFKATNNEAEYKAMVVGLRLAKALGTTRLKVMSNSQLIVNQISGDYTARDTKMTEYLELVNQLRSEFKKCEIT